MRVAGAVEVGVVQENHVSRKHSVQRSAGDPGGRREPAPVLAPARPQQWGQPGAVHGRAGRSGCRSRTAAGASAAARRPCPRSRPGRARCRREPRPGSGAAGGGGEIRAGRPRGRRRRSRPPVPASAAPARRSRRKWLARPRASRTSSTAGVPSGWGPSSKVSATPAASGSRQGSSRARAARSLTGARR